MEALIKVNALSFLGHPGAAAGRARRGHGLRAGAGARPGHRPGLALRHARRRGDARWSSACPTVTEAPSRERLRWEKELLGLYLSDHPLGEMADRDGRLRQHLDRRHRRRPRPGARRRRRHGRGHPPRHHPQQGVDGGGHAGGHAGLGRCRRLPAHLCRRRRRGQADRRRRAARRRARRPQGRRDGRPGRRGLDLGRGHREGCHEPSPRRSPPAIVVAARPAAQRQWQRQRQRHRQWRGAPAGWATSARPAERQPSPAETLVVPRVSPLRGSQPAGTLTITIGGAPPCGRAPSRADQLRRSRRASAPPPLDIPPQEPMEPISGPSGAAGLRRRWRPKGRMSRRCPTRPAQPWPWPPARAPYPSSRRSRARSCTSASRRPPTSGSWPPSRSSRRSSSHDPGRRRSCCTSRLVRDARRRCVWASASPTTPSCWPSVGRRFGGLLQLTLA